MAKVDIQSERDCVTEIYDDRTERDARAYYLVHTLKAEGVDTSEYTRHDGTYYRVVFDIGNARRLNHAT